MSWLNTLLNSLKSHLDGNSLQQFLIIFFIWFGVVFNLEILFEMFLPNWSYPEKNKKIKFIKIIITCIIVFSLTHSITYR